MNIDSFPKELAELIAGHTITKDEMGCSGAVVCRLDGAGEPLWLKAEQTDRELKRERDALRWLKGRANVPKVLYFGTEGGFDYLLDTHITGEMACSAAMLANPEQTTRLLAEGMKLLHSIDISGCPIDNRLEIKLASAWQNISLGLVDTADWEPDNTHSTPEDLLRYLREHRPDGEDLVFTHGDYCLPNVFIRDGAVSGFIDLGRAGIADRWQDIALCIRSMHHNFHTDVYDELLFECLGITPDWEKFRYYVLLDELF